MFCLVFYFLYFIFSQINSFYFKIKYFYKKNHFKNLFQKFIRFLRIKIFFLFLKNNMQPYFVRFASFSVFNKNFSFEQRHESKLVVPHKWDNSELNSCISIGELVKPLHKKIFSKIIFVAIFCHLLKLCLSFLGIVYKMCVIINVFIYFDNFCYAN